eukprot:Hpha_TRINITY_DN16203_c0_g7::TRINITY_DN16203_c0_g7_i2::g.11516::m.11516
MEGLFCSSPGEWSTALYDRLDDFGARLEEELYGAVKPGNVRIIEQPGKVWTRDVCMNFEHDMDFEVSYSMKLEHGILITLTLRGIRKEDACSKTEIVIKAELGAEVEKCELDVGLSYKRGGLLMCTMGGPLQFDESNKERTLSKKHDPAVCGGDFVIETGLASLALRARPRPTGIEPLLCSKLCTLQDAVARQIGDLHTKEELLSWPARARLERAAAASRGCYGMPGEVAAAVPVAELRRMVEGVRAPMKLHFEAVSRTVLEVAVQVMEDVFKGSPRAVRFFHEEMKSFMEDALDKAHSMGQMLLRWQCQVYTSNEFYSKAVAEEEKTIAEEIAKSVEHHSVASMQVKVYAFWLTLVKRLTDFIVLCSRDHLAITPVEQIKSRLRSSVGDRQPEAILSPDAHSLERRRVLHEQIERLVTAKGLYADYMRDA